MGYSATSSISPLKRLVSIDLVSDAYAARRWVGGVGRFGGDAAGSGGLAGVENAVEIDADERAIVGGDDVGLRALRRHADTGDVDAGGG